MELKVLEIKHNKLEAKLITYNTTDSIVGCKIGKLRIDFRCYKVLETSRRIKNEFLFVKFDKQNEKDNTLYRCDTSIQKIYKKLHYVYGGDTNWRLLFEESGSNQTFNEYMFIMKVETVTTGNRFSVLNDDTDLTDFELRGADGAVSMHSAVLACYSPVLRRMVSGCWRETENRCLEIKDASKTTLQHFKDYIYRDVLPEDGVEDLLLFASCYMMPELEEKCIDILLGSLAPENVKELLKFAFGNELDALYIAILELIQEGTIKVTEIREKMDQNNK